MIALALLCFPLLYLPGLLLSWALGAAARPADALERHYERVAVGALLNGWLALTLAELGLFSLALHAALLLLICAALLLVAWRRKTLPRLRPLQHSALSTQHSALSTQHSALGTQHSALSTRYLDLRRPPRRHLRPHRAPLPGAARRDGRRHLR